MGKEEESDERGGLRTRGVGIVRGAVVQMVEGKREGGRAEQLTYRHRHRC